MASPTLPVVITGMSFGRLCAGGSGVACHPSFQNSIWWEARSARQSLSAISSGPSQSTNLRQSRMSCCVPWNCLDSLNFTKHQLAPIADEGHLYLHRGIERIGSRQCEASRCHFTDQLPTLVVAPGLPFTHLFE